MHLCFFFYEIKMFTEMDGVSKEMGSTCTTNENEKLKFVDPTKSVKWKENLWAKNVYKFL